MENKTSPSQDAEPSSSNTAADCEIAVKTCHTPASLSSDSKRSIVQHPIVSQERKFLGASVSEWNNWRWQLHNRLRTQDQLEQFFRLSDDERRALTEPVKTVPVAITPYYASLIDEQDATQPIRRTMIPVIHEYIQSPEEAEDPLNEDQDSPVPGIVHRYPDRVLFLVTHLCASYCRYCTRSRMVGGHERIRFTKKEWDVAIEYIENNSSIRDVLLSGGDPLMLSDDRLDYLLGRIRKIKHVEVVRIGTKIPVVLPQRITPELVKVLRKYHPLWMSIHFTHPDELTPEAQEACSRLADVGIPLGSQTVLLEGINDNVETIKSLCQGLMRFRVRPYYLYQCDPIIGSSHFRTPVQKGLDIIRGLRGFTSGYAVPNFVIDAPGGGGKIPLLPDYAVRLEDGQILLTNYEGKLFSYPDKVKKSAAA